MEISQATSFSIEGKGMGRLHLWGNWYLERRLAPLAGDALYILFHLLLLVPEATLAVLAILSVLLQFRRKLLKIVSGLFGPPDHSAAYLDYGLEAFTSRMPTDPNAALWIVVIGLACVSGLAILAYSRRTRRFFLKCMVVTSALIAAAACGLIFFQSREEIGLVLVLAGISIAHYMLAFLISTYRIRHISPK